MTDFPEGRYLSAVGFVRLGAGGQTGAMLLRSRLISHARGVPVDVLTFDPYPDYDQVRTEFSRVGQLTGDMRLLNLYEHYRDQGWGDETATGGTLPPLPGLRKVEIRHPDESLWQTAYRDEAGESVYNDFHRRDGSTYLRASSYRTGSVEDYPSELIRVDPDGQVLGRFASLAEWYHRWLLDLASGHKRTILFMDSRYLVPIIAPAPDRNLHLVYVLHNCHVPAPRTWDTPPKPDYRRCLERIDDLDVFVTLTDRQRQDIEQAWGHHDNMAVVPNPVGSVVEPQPLPVRDPQRVITLARLEHQKRVEDAVLVMELVVQEIPDARLDIYGQGSQRPRLEQMIAERGLSANVVLHGHRADARDELWTASAFLLTSRYEGYPLSALESYSRGCPVVAYDIPYGPREQVTDDVDGYLVPDGDIDQAAARVVALLTSPPLVARLGLAGRRTAERHSETLFLQRWSEILSHMITSEPPDPLPAWTARRVEVRSRSGRQLVARLLARHWKEGLHHRLSQILRAGGAARLKNVARQASRRVRPSAKRDDSPSGPSS